LKFSGDGNVPHIVQYVNSSLVKLSPDHVPVLGIVGDQVVSGTAAIVYTPGVHVIALCGSLRFRSSNRALLLAAQKLAPEGMDVSIFESIGDLPHFNPDLDGPERDPEDRPDAVLQLRHELAASNAMLISTPEYAHGLPGSLKNALDWLVSCPEMIGKPVALIYGSTGKANHAQEHLMEILTTMSAVVVRDAIVEVMGVRSKIDDHGTVSDPHTVSQIQHALMALAAFASRERQ
jgi:NAD(P)H-dependent FMN reductase